MSIVFELTNRSNIVIIAFIKNNLKNFKITMPPLFGGITFVSLTGMGGVITNPNFYGK